MCCSRPVSLPGSRFVLLALAVFSGALQTTALAQSSGKSQAAEATIAIVAWNIEGAGSDMSTIRKQLDALAPLDIFALSEVPPEAAKALFATKWGDESAAIGETGGAGRLMISWNPVKFDKVAAHELQRIDGEEFAPGVQTAPLVVELRHRGSGRKFQVLMNHLARGSDQLRRRQAELLTSWAGKQTEPVVAVGGYNFDYDFIKRRGNEAFDIFQSSDVWKWVEPKQFVDTNWADRNRDGKDDYPDSMLDFVYVAVPAKQWKVECEVVVRPGDFPDDDKTSDQRPIRTTVQLP
ncbi:MAG: hypothetical protein ACTHOU_00395 [Aureliella sp.]